MPFVFNLKPWYKNTKAFIINTFPYTGRAPMGALGHGTYTIS